MPAIKIAITLEESLLQKIDRLVRRKVYSNRSKAIQAAVAEKMIHLDQNRLERECRQLDPAYEQRLAEEGFNAEVEQWPEY
jgi:metal-responsive CopG/Arc/MetJ family transcriptional regulator